MQNDKLKFKEEFKKRLYKFVLKLIEFIDKLPKDGITRIISDQLTRSGTGILGTYIEGTASSYFNHSLKSSVESKVWLALLKDSGRAKSEDVEWFLNELDEFSKIFASSNLTLKGKK